MFSHEKWRVGRASIVHFFSFLLVCLTSAISASRHQRPHIIVFMVDDLGWHDVGYQGAEFDTPNIDSLANDGLVLKNFYAQPLCSPSRVSFMTGQHPVEKGAQNAVFKHLSRAGLDADENLLPEWLKVYGYSTYLVGKWHLGQATFDQTPAGQGFDEFFGFFGAYIEHFTHQYGFDLPVYCDEEVMDTREKWGYDLWENTTPIGEEFEGIYATELYTEKAEYFIRNHARSSEGESMFLWVSYAAAHDPFQAPLSYVNGRECSHIGNSERDFRRILCGMMQTVDGSIGNIVNALEEVDYLDDSIIIFMSDNGAAAIESMLMDGNEPAGSNWPLRGSKTTLFEGGVRVPAFIWPHPQTLSAFQPLDPPHESYELFHISDWFLTILDMAGIPSVESKQKTLKTARRLDLTASYNQWPSMISGSSSPRDNVFINLAWPLDKKYGAIRNRDFKLFMGADDTMVDGWFNPANRTQEEVICDSIADCREELPDELFWNIREDPEERHPLDLRRLDSWEQDNYDELSDMLDEWSGVVQSLQQADELLDAEGLPMYWDCHWSPWISTAQFPLEQGSKTCRDGDVSRHYCGRSAHSDDWLEYAK